MPVSHSLDICDRVGVMGGAWEQVKIWGMGYGYVLLFMKTELVIILVYELLSGTNGSQNNAQMSECADAYSHYLLVCEMNIDQASDFC